MSEAGAPNLRHFFEKKKKCRLNFEKSRRSNSKQNKKKTQKHLLNFIF